MSFFNNKKNCTFEDKCVFLHKESEKCRFGKIRERINCTFRHNSDDGDIDEDVIEIESETDDNYEEVQDEEWNVGNEKNAAERTFIIPSQIDVDKVVEEPLNLNVDEVVNEIAQTAINERINSRVID